MFAHIVPHKGSQRHWYQVSAMMRDLEFTGYTRIVMKADQESAITDLIQNVKDGQSKIEIMLEHSPVGDSQANGDAERAVQSVQGIARTLKEALEISIAAEVPVAHDVMTWLVEHAAIILNLFKRSHGGDHLTA